MRQAGTPNPLHPHPSGDGHQRLGEASGLSRLLLRLREEGALHYPAGQLLQLKGEPQQGVLVMVAGLAKVRAFSADGTEEVLWLLGPGDVEGLGSLLESGSKWLDVVALTATQVVRLPAGALQELLSQDPRMYLSCLAQQQNHMKAQARQTMCRRLAAGDRVLATMQRLACKANGGKASLEAATVPPMSLRELSAITGLAKETVCRCIRQLERKQRLQKELEGWRLNEPWPHELQPTDDLLRQAALALQAQT